MSHSITKKLFGFVLSVLVLIYVIYLFYSSNFSMLQTEIVYNMTVEDTIDTQGFVVRKEKTVAKSNSGVISYNLSDGDKINNGGVIAYTYALAQDTANMQEAERIEKEIAELEKLNKSSANITTNVETIDTQINNELTELMTDLNRGSYASLRSNHNLLYYINERQLVTGEIKSLSARIAALKERKSQLESNSGGSTGAVYAPVSGYFISNVDGYENAVDYSKIDKIYPDDFDAIKKEDVNASDYAGKLVESTDWYVLCKVSSEQALKISESGKKFFNLYIPFAVTGSLPVQLYSVNQLNKNDSAVLVLRCNRVNSETSRIRNDTIQLAVNEYSGLRVSKKALHDATLTKKVKNDEDGSEKEISKKVQGVYTLYGNELIFKQVVITYSGTDYVICDPEPNSEDLFYGETVELYDKIIVEGTDLYDGKIVNT